MTDQVDWRAEVVTTLAADWISPWTGTTHPAGARVAKVTVGPDAQGQPLAFASPSPEAMSLNLAIEAAKRSRDLRRTVIVDPLSRGSDSTSVRDEDLTALYDYLEACCVTVTFAFQALEAFANREIDTAVTGTHELLRDGERFALTSGELQRRLSTDEKLETLLPELLNTRSPNGRAPWFGYRALKRERDAIVHLKADDAYPRGRPDRQSIFHRFFSDGVAHHPAHAIRMIEWFYADRPSPSWLVQLRADAGRNPGTQARRG